MSEYGTVGDLRLMLAGLPDDMPLFRISDYWGTCAPVSSDDLPTVETVRELQFVHGRDFHCGSTDGLIEHEVVRELSVLNMD